MQNNVKLVASHNYHSQAQITNLRHWSQIQRQLSKAIKKRSKIYGKLRFRYNFSGENLRGNSGGFGIVRR